MATRMLQRRGTAADWAALNPVLSEGEIGFEIDTKILKVGDGETPWNDLNMSYLTPAGGQMTGHLLILPPSGLNHPVRLQDLRDATDHPSLRALVRYSFSGTFIKANYPWMRSAFVRVIGGGGAGGGADSPSGSPGDGSAGGGGSAATYCESYLTEAQIPASVPVTVAAGGVGVNNNVGGVGGESSFGDLVVAPGGPGGGAAMSPGTSMVVFSGTAVSASGVGHLQTIGMGGEATFRLTGSQMKSGAGGSSAWGSGGRGRGSGGDGYDGRGRGAGGGGAQSRNGQGLARGGHGSAGYVAVELYQ